MSRIGKQPIEIPQGVEITIQEGKVSVKGPLGVESVNICEGITVAKEDNKNITKYSINIKNYKTNNYIFHENLSGFEKAILQFVIMHIINSFSSYSFNIFYIDEAFDVFDEDNFKKAVPNLLQIAADYTSNVLFVTHRNIPFIQSNCIFKTIDNKNGFSTI